MNRKTAGAILAAALALASSGAAHAQTYPSRSIILIAPFAAGGPSDVVARIVGEHMSRTLGQAITIENVVGAGGTTGSSRAMRANPDGYTIQIGHMGTHAVSVALYPNLAYKPDIDFEPIGLVVEQPMIILARKDFPPADLKEFVAYVKANVEKVNAAHSGVGSLSFTYCLLLHSIIGVRPTSVPFGGGAPAMNALIGGQVDYFCEAISNVVPQVQSGTIKAYAIGSAERSPTLPAVPTAKEAGLPLEVFFSIAEDLNRRKIIGRFSTFLEHVKPSAGGIRVTRFNGLFHWAVPTGMEIQAGSEVGRHEILTHCYWREAGAEFGNVNIMAVAHGTEKQRLLDHKAAIDRHLAACGIPVSYTNVFWGGRSEIKPSEISPMAYREWLDRRNGEEVVSGSGS